MSKNIETENIASLTEQKVIVDKGIGEESLLPQEQRIMDRVSYTMAWIGGCVFIGYFMLGASLVPPVGQLNLFQAFVAVSTSMILVAVMFTLNGQAGHKYGIPFVIQARPAFGIKGAKLPLAIRAVPALMWYGVQTWVGALALSAVSRLLLGFESVPFYFVTFLILQIVLSITGFKGIKWLENIGAAIIIVSLAYMYYVIYTNYGMEVQARIIDIPGTWGLAFWGGTTAFVGVYTTLMLNIGDYTRELTKSSTKTGMTISHLIGLLPTTIFMSMIGLLAAGVTGVWDPIELFVELLPGTGILIFALFFIVLAQITTNVMLNVVPAAYVIMDFFPKLNWKKASVISGLLTFLTFPWYITTASGFFLFIQVYSVFLGPIFAILIVDYYLIRKQTLDLDKLYDDTYKGINWAGIIAMLVGVAFALIEIQLSWYISLIPAGVTYYVLMKYWGAKAYRHIGG